MPMTSEILYAVRDIHTIKQRPSEGTMDDREIERDFFLLTSYQQWACWIAMEYVKRKALSQLLLLAVDM